MKKILIAGASGAVGLGMTARYLAGGNGIVAVVRSVEKADTVRNFVVSQGLSADKLYFIENEFDNERKIRELQEHLATLGYIDLAIASLGGWHHGPALHQLPTTNWNEVVKNSLTSHFHFAKSVLPMLEKQASGCYVMVNGGASEFAVPHSGVISVMAAAQKMMGQVFHNELALRNIKVFNVAAFAVVRTVYNNDPSLWLTAERIADYILSLSSHNGQKAKEYWHRLMSDKDLNLS